MTSSHPLPVPCQWFSWLAGSLDRRSAPRLALLFLGAVLARGRRTVTTWIRAAKLSGQYQSCYVAVAAAGKRADRIALRLFIEVVRPLLAGATRLTLALDDTPTKRSGPHVQGAGVHHNPAPGPAGSSYVYGHVFVVLAILVTHEAWGTVALPLLSRLHVRKKDLPAIDPKHRPEFRTKLELAVELLRWARPWLDPLKLAALGGGRRRLCRQGRLPRAGDVAGDDRGQPAPQGCRVTHGARAPAAGATRSAPIYGKDKIDLAKRAGQRRVAGRPRHVHPVRREGGRAVQDVPCDLAAGRRRDPGGAGGRADRPAGVLLHRPLGERRQHPGYGGRSLQPGDHLPRVQADRRGGSAAVLGCSPLFGPHQMGVSSTVFGMFNL